MWSSRLSCIFCNLAYFTAAAILSIFLYILINSHVESLRQVESLRLKVDEISRGHKFFRKNRFDFASELNGGKIIEIDGTELVNHPLEILLGWTSNTPRQLIQSSMQPGHCFAFKGAEGSITIQLSQKAYIDTIVVGHISSADIPTQIRDNAPKDFSVWGMRREKDLSPQHLGAFTYDIDNDELHQPFSIMDHSRDPESYQYIRVNFIRNHGNPTHTCVYEIRVYGIVY